MRILRSIFTISLLLIGFSLAACNLSASTEAPPLDQSAAQTAAAETIIAQLTDVAETLTPVSSEAPPPEATPTQVIEAATETSPPVPTATEVVAVPSATATSPPPPTPTLDANDPKAGLGEPDFQDTFADASNWPLYTDQHVSFEIKDSKLVMTAFNPDFYNGWILPPPVISDYYLEMETETKECSGKDQHGLMVRAVKTDQGYIGYHYAISCDGHFTLRRWNGSQYIPLVDWTASDRIIAGSNQVNRIGLMANGNKLSLYANGSLVGEYQDDTHLEGRFGVFIGSAITPNVTTEVDEIAYWNIP
ncbi:MAG: hypothetical protein JSV69_10630 [Chloroflexota bacterium]|nr:MAG: hypothetical protein JSV69_10630 [Chloroflexota bacterium]UCF28030.1 MAG: hypothetical protein JSW42_15655 [Chloroflexota bacterium]